MLPDQNHINRVREALWRRPGAGASVMVGSGFSRNARAKGSPSKHLPTLEELAGEIFATLYPQSEPSDKVPPERVLRLAQEYQGEFGPDALHDQLCRLVPDEDFKPGNVHKRLLRLPWADVFTTNWDTLLERTRELVPDRPYTVVRSKTDFLQGTRPRIVKLHGSLPDPPLILTEEDYRTYPSVFAPFVHTVRQAMMETVFLLVGFSGNDPNFLRWSGWMRDNFGETAPKIYLAGYLELSRPTRRMWRDSNVVTIDLAQHPRAPEWPEDLQHRYATEWILASLECGEPYNVLKWPSPRAKTSCSEDNPLLQPIVANLSGEPKAETLEPPRQVPDDARLKTARETIDSWAHNRRCYPGWLVLPAGLRRDLRATTERWTPFILSELSGMVATERLAAVREIMWRHELSLARIPDELASVAQEVLESIDCGSRTVEGNRDKEVDWTVTRAVWRDVALTLLTEARYRFDGSAFRECLDALRPFLRADTEVTQRVHHERCLWASWSLDYGSLRECLDAWPTGEGDPAWMVRKSALLREAGREEDADRLIKEALGEIRTMPKDGQDLAGSSREGWALWSVATYPRINNVRERWNKLAAANCDPSMEIEFFANALAARSADAFTPHFDLGVRSGAIPRRSGWQVEAIAYRSMRLTEVAGLPLSIDITSIAAHLLKLVSERLMAFNPLLAMRQMLRAVTYDRDGAFRRVFSRERIAALARPVAIGHAQAFHRAAKDAIVRMDMSGQRRDFDAVLRARVALEAVSRLVTRLDSESVESILDDALRFYGNPRVAAEVFLDQPLRNLLRRSWDSLPEERRTHRILDILDSPIVGLGDFGSEYQSYPDPGELLSHELSAPERSKHNESRWESIVATLIRGLEGTGMARERASVRIAYVALWHRLTEGEGAKVARCLWGQAAGDDGDELPAGTPLFDYSFILLPEPTVGMGRRRFGRKWLSGDIGRVRLTGPYEPGSAVGGTVSHTNPNKADDILWQVGMAIAFLHRRGRALNLVNEEANCVADVIEKWTRTRIPSTEHIPALVHHVFAQSVRGAYRGLSWILTELQISRTVAEQLYEQVQEFNDGGLPGYRVLPGIANVTPDRLDDISVLISGGMMSDDYQMASSALVSLHMWMRWASDSALEFTAPPGHLIQEVGISIATRRQSVLALALHAAKWIFEAGTEEQRSMIRDLVVKGLGYLAEELRYDRVHAFDERFDMALARWRCAQVARAMAREGLDENPAVSRWLEMGKEDPLPEVRHVADTWYEEGAPGVRVGRDGAGDDRGKRLG